MKPYLLAFVALILVGCFHSENDKKTLNSTKKELRVSPKALLKRKIYRSRRKSCLRSSGLPKVGNQISFEVNNTCAKREDCNLIVYYTCGSNGMTRSTSIPIGGMNNNSKKILKKNITDCKRMRIRSKFVSCK